MLKPISKSKTILLVGLVLNFAASACSSASAQVSRSTSGSNNHTQTQACSDEAVRGYISKLNRPELTNSDFAALVECGNQAVPALVQALRDERSEEGRASAAYVLGQIGSDANAAVPELIELLNERSEASASAVYVLGQIGSDANAAVPELIELLNEEDTTLQILGMNALRRITPHSGSAVQPLISIIRNENEAAYVRAVAVNILTRIDPQAAVTAMDGAPTIPDEISRYVDSLNVASPATLVRQQVQRLSIPPPSICILLGRLGILKAIPRCIPN